MSTVKHLFHNLIVRCLLLFARILDADKRVPLYLEMLAKEVGHDRLVQLYLSELARALDQKSLMTAYLTEVARVVEPDERFLVPGFEKGHGPESERFFSYQEKFISFDIKPGEKVLDVGSGAYPFPHATHLADLFEFGTTHRTEPLAKKGLPFDVCNIEKLPYGSKEFDFVYCSHVLEHVSDPARACEELMRVGKKGFIETPTRLSDVMLNFIRLENHHRWHINLLGNTLIFMEWTDRERRDTNINEFFKMLHSRYKNPFQDLVHNHRDLFVNMFVWTEQFHYLVLDKHGSLIATNKS